jgi:ATP phosphoribosyltransferase
VLAVDGESKYERLEDLPEDARVATEYPRLTARWLADRGIKADVRLSYGATEAKVPEIAEAIVELTETGRALRAAGLRIIDTVLESHTELVASPRAIADPSKAHAMEQIRTLLAGALDARGRVLVKLNVSDANLEQVISVLPSMKSPTVSKLFGDGGYAVETVVLKSEINILIPELVDRGASDILELPLSKIVVR